MVITEERTFTGLSRRSVLVSKHDETPAEFQPDEFAAVWHCKEPTQMLILLGSLDPPFRMVHPIHVHVVTSPDGVIASFWDANIHSSGETIADALYSLKSLIADTYQMLFENRDVLGPAPSMEFAALQRFVQPL